MDRRNFEYMFYGFTVAWLIVFVYVLTLVRRGNRLRAELQRHAEPIRWLRPAALNTAILKFCPRVPIFIATSACRCRSTSRSPTRCRRRCAIACRRAAACWFRSAARKLTGVVLRCHDDAPGVATREALRLIDAEPVLDAELLALGRWIAGYYCAPLGEVLRGMLPLASEIRRGKVWSLTDAGRDAARQLLLDAAPDDPVAQILRMLEKRPLSAAYLKRNAAAGRQSHPRRWNAKASSWSSRCRPSAIRCARPPSGCASSSTGAAPAEAKLNKPERELQAFLELHPGSHNLKDLEAMVRDASAAARSLARKRLVALQRRSRSAIDAAPVRAPHTLNPAQQAAFEQIRRRHSRRANSTRFCCTASPARARPKSICNAIDAALARRPQRAAAGARNRADARHGRPVLSAASATAWPFCTAPSPTSERSEQWRRIRSGAARWWWGRAPACSRRCATWG